MRKIWLELYAALGANILISSRAFADNCSGGIEDCLRTGGFTGTACTAGAIAAGLAAFCGGDPSTADDAGEKDSSAIPTAGDDATTTTDVSPITGKGSTGSVEDVFDWRSSSETPAETTPAEAGDADKASGGSDGRLPSARPDEPPVKDPIGRRGPPDGALGDPPRPPAKD